MELATTVALVALRGPVPLAKTLAALDVLSDGRVVAGSVPARRSATTTPSASPTRSAGSASTKPSASCARSCGAIGRRRPCRHYPLPGSPLAPAPRRPGGIPLWIGSWGSKAGLRRVARLGDGWLASAYNTTPEGFEAAKESLSERLDAHGKDPGRFPNALATMWTWITEDTREADRVLREVLAPMLRREPDVLRDQLCIGPAEKCAELLSRYAQAGCERVYLWPLGDEPRQIELAATAVLPAVESPG